MKGRWYMVAMPHGLLACPKCIWHLVASHNGLLDGLTCIALNVLACKHLGMTTKGKDNHMHWPSWCMRTEFFVFVRQTW